MVAEITAILSSVKAASDIVQGISAIKTDTAVKEKAVELLNIIITLQSQISSHHISYNQIVQEKSDLEQKIMNTKKWERRKKKYIFNEISPGVFAYAHKIREESASDKHWLCANCFDAEQKESVLQNKIRGNRPSHIYYCPQCKNEISIKNLEYKPVKISSIKRRSSWLDNR